jgi:hypothetical protein
MRSLFARGAIALAVLFSLAATALAGGQETRDGIKSLTVIAGRLLRQ